MTHTLTESRRLLCPEACSQKHDLWETLDGNVYVLHEALFGDFVYGSTYSPVDHSDPMPAQAGISGADLETLTVEGGLTPEVLRVLAGSLLKAAEWLESQA